MDQKQLFHFLQPVCVASAKDPSYSNISALLDSLQQLNRGGINSDSMFEYCCFPLKLALKKRETLSEKQIELILRCFSALIEKASPSCLVFEHVLYIFNCCSLLLDGNLPELSGAKLGVPSEEVKCVAVQLLDEVGIQLKEDLFADLFSEANLPVVGHLISLLLKFAEKEKFLELRLRSLSVLEKLCGKGLASSKVLFGAVFASFLPGIAMSFNRIVKQANQGHKILVAILDTFGYIVSLVLHDRDFPCLAENEKLELPFKASQQHSSNKMGTISKLRVFRSIEWLKTTSSNLRTVFHNALPVLLAHQHASVRLATVLFIKQIMTNCLRSLEDSVLEFVSYLSEAKFDCYESVSLEASSTLHDLCELFGRNGSQKLQSSVEEHLYVDLLSLPRVINCSSCDDIKLQKLRMLNGLLSFCGDRLAKILYSRPHLEKLFASLLQITEFEDEDVKLVQERIDIGSSIALFDDKVRRGHYASKNFKGFANSEILSAVQSILALLGTYGDLELLVDYVSEVFFQSSTQRRQAVWLLNEVISSQYKILTENFDKRRLHHVVEQLLDVYACDDFWYATTSNVPSSTHGQSNDVPSEPKLHSSPALSVRELNCNIQLICLLLEGVGVFVKCLGKDFSNHLIRWLYRVLEKAGCENAAISQAAFGTLETICSFAGYQSLGELILLNVDYLINAVTMEFRHLSRNSAAADVLCVVLRGCDAKILPFISDAMSDVFHALDVYQEEVALPFLKVLVFLAEAIYLWFVKDATRDCVASKVAGTKLKSSLAVCNNNETVRHFFESYCEDKLIATGSREFVLDEPVVDKPVACEEEGCHLDKVEDEKKPPLQFQVILTSLEKCCHFVGARSVPVKVLALDVIARSVLALQLRENDLLPAIHSLWPPVVQRLKDTDKIVALKTLDTISSMVTVSGDFMRARITKELLPVAFSFLKEFASQPDNRLWKFSHRCKLAVKLISLLADIFPGLDMAREDVCRFCWCTALCLDFRQPEIVRKAAESALIAIAKTEFDIVWSAVHLLHGKELRHQDTLFPPVKFTQIVDHKRSITYDLELVLSTVRPRS